jgi:hypothetical protein
LVKEAKNWLLKTKNLKPKINEVPLWVGNLYMNSMLYVWRTSYKGSEKKYISDYQKISFWIFLFQNKLSRNNAKSKFYWRGFPSLIPWFGSYKTSFVKK